MRYGVKVSFIALTMYLLAGSAAADPRSLHAVRIDGGAFLGDLPTIVADARGLFGEQGLETAIHYSKSGVRNMQRLRAGEVDFALMALTPFVVDRLSDPTPGEGDDPVILASLLQAHELIALVTAPNSGIESAADFVDKRVAVEPGTNSEFVWWLFEQFYGIKSESVQLTQIALADMAEAMTAGRLDAALMPEPWATNLEADMAGGNAHSPRRFDTRDFYVGKWVLVTTRNQVRQHGDTCRKILSAYHQAIDFIEIEPNQALSLYNVKIQESKIVEPKNWLSVTYDINLDWSLIAGLQQQLHWAQSAGYGTSDQAVNVLEFVEPGPLHQAAPQAVHLPKALTMEKTP